MKKNLNLVEAIKLSENNHSKITINVISSFNFDYYKYFLNANFFYKKIDFKISKTYSNQLKLNLLNYSNNSKSELWIFIDWIDLIPHISLRSDSFETANSNLKFKKKNINELINILLKIGKKKRILIFAPHTNLVSDHILNINFDNKLESLSIWNFFIKKIEKNKINNIKLVNKEFNKYDICTESLYRSNTPINMMNLGNYANNLSEIFKKKYNKKLIITDLDGTLWRGVLGESGASAVSWERESNSFKHLYYQKMLREIYQKGKILAIASKNEIFNVEKVFARQDLLLKKKYFSSIKCSWTPKSQMINDILKELNLGDDSFLFIDDSKFELEEVKKNFPKAEYLLFPEENIDFINFIKEFYKNFNFTTNKDDRLRNKSYKALKKVNENKSNLNNFLENIDMVCRATRLKDENDNRAFELINKTNQFNLNGIRIYEENKKKYFLKNYFIIKFSLIDKLADHGTIGVVICKKKEHNMYVEFMVLSCRVFSRNVESVFLKVILNLAKKYEIKNIYFNYNKTNKNSLVKEFFLKNLIKKNSIDIVKFVFSNNFLGKIKISKF